VRLGGLDEWEVAKDVDVQLLREAIRAHPFKSFAINLTDGRRFEIWRPELMAVSPKGQRAVVINEDDSWSIVEPPLISSLDFSAPKQKNDPPTPPT
jgi:hypothetical protein